MAKLDSNQTYRYICILLAHGKQKQNILFKGRSGYIVKLSKTNTPDKQINKQNLDSPAIP